MTSPAGETRQAFPPDTNMRIGRVESLDTGGVNVSVSGQIIPCGFVNPGGYEVGQPVAIFRNGAAWLALGSVSAGNPPSSTVVGSAVFQGAGFNNATAIYSSLLNPVTFNKLSPTSILRVDFHSTFFTNAATSGINFAVLIGATDYLTCAVRPPLPGTFIRFQASGVALIPNIQAGITTITPRFRRDGGAGTVSLSSDDFLSFAVSEVRS